MEPGSHKSQSLDPLAQINQFQPSNINIKGSITEPLLYNPGSRSAVPVSSMYTSVPPPVHSSNPYALTRIPQAQADRTPIRQDPVHQEDMSRVQAESVPGVARTQPVGGAHAVKQEEKSSVKMEESGDSSVARVEVGRGLDLTDGPRPSAPLNGPAVQHAFFRSINQFAVHQSIGDQKIFSTNSEANASPPIPMFFPKSERNSGFAEREMKKFNQDQISLRTVLQKPQESAKVKIDCVREACTMTESPLQGGIGSKINLDGLVLNETDGGLLVVNVMYKGKDYMGTLMDCTTPANSWASPRHSDIPPPDKRPKKKKVKGESDIELSARASLRNRRNNQRRQRKTRKRKWEENKNRPRLEK